MSLWSLGNLEVAKPFEDALRYVLDDEHDEKPPPFGVELVLALVYCLHDVSSGLLWGNGQHAWQL